MQARVCAGPLYRAQGLVVIIVVLALIAGCGFQKRGQGGPTAQLEGSFTIAGGSFRSQFTRALRRALTDAGGRWVDDRDTADTVIVIEATSSEQRVLSIDSRNRAVEYELEESVRFKLRRRYNDSTVAPQTIRVLRILFRPSRTVVAGDRERDLLREEMREQLADRVVRRIAARQ